MKKRLIVSLFTLLALLCAGCISSRVPTVDLIVPQHGAAPDRFVLNEEFGVYFYPKPIASFFVSGIPLSLRMTAASSGALGGWLGGRDRDFFGILPVGSQIRIAGTIPRKAGLCYVVEVEETTESELQGTYIEIFFVRKNYSQLGTGANVSRLNEALFRPLKDSTFTLLFV